MNKYRRKVWALLDPLFRATGAPGRVLDFGCGDGWFASQVLAHKLAADLVPIDVKRRDNVLVEPMIYRPGQPLPFETESFDTAYSIDVLHHCDDPFAQLDELDRVTKRHLVIKDHTYRTNTGRWALAVLDELGNRKFGIPSPYHYQRDWTWTEHLQKRGWALREIVHPAECHEGALGWLTNRLQYVARYERVVG